MTTSEIAAHNNGLIIGMTMGLQVVREVVKTDIIRVDVAGEIAGPAVDIISVEPQISIGLTGEILRIADSVLVSPQISIGTTVLLED